MFADRETARNGLGDTLQHDELCAPPVRQDDDRGLAEAPCDLGQDARVGGDQQFLLPPAAQAAVRWRRRLTPSDRRREAGFQAVMRPPRVPPSERSNASNAALRRPMRMAMPWAS
jgi:hypothetical protein